MMRRGAGNKERRLRVRWGRKLESLKKKF